MNIRERMKELPREELAVLPTPVQRLSNTEKMLGAAHAMYIKRDDLTGIGAGGNKVRCMEYIIGEAKHEGCDTILVSGGLQSNFCSLAAACCARAGMKCVIVHNSDEPQERQGNVLLNDLMGVERIWMGACDSSIREQYVYEVMEQLKARGDRPYLIRGYGGINALGYVNAVIEMVDQFKEMKLDIKHVFAPGGNAGIASGLIYGNALMGFPFRMHIISVEDDTETLSAHIRDAIAEMEEITGIPFGRTVAEAADIVEDYRGEGWSINTPESTRMVYDFCRREGIHLENIYNAKLFVGYEDMVKQGRVDGDSAVIHTGGFGSLFAQF
ncbi:MAG: pyridoxal-phosphate dependent enzyme [Solobacterium sp.]|nr:pyridoxal-phosphate dependent enzyme [Solobacterium sp.]MBQ2688702.1 pyridoxal-phosphate dependent enzyme [Solobacterium sp.]MBR0478550.1 pyridoxal-phosphate dependent enzyme [Solobacterium sp.]